MRKVILGLGLLSGLVGCVAPVRSVSTGPVADPGPTLQQAEQAGAATVPEAAQHLEWARQQTQGAQQLLAQNRRRDAELFLMRAEADAQLALALAREAPVRAEADRLLEQVRRLQTTVQ